MKKKVLIVSKGSLETSTERVMEWILYLGHEVVRINGDLFESKEKAFLFESSKDVSLFVERGKLSKNYYSIWMRRWSDYELRQSLIDNLSLQNFDNGLAITLTECLTYELAAIEKSIVGIFKCKKYLTNFNQISVNKVTVLHIAKSHKLKVPDFILTNRKKHLIDFKKKKNIILKDFGGHFTFFDKIKNTFFVSFGELLDDEKIYRLPEKFIFSFFQEYIEKEYEIRAFFLNGKVYSMAIFSQKDPKTKVDFRRYNQDNANRTVPYQLPRSIEQKLVGLMRTLNLDTGSIDLLKSKDGNYYFLEVNPVGQFGMVSHPCNYNLEYQIAKHLIS